MIYLHFLCTSMCLDGVLGSSMFAIYIGKYFIIETYAAVRCVTDYLIFNSFFLLWCLLDHLTIILFLFDKKQFVVCFYFIIFVFWQEPRNTKKYINYQLVCIK